MVQAHRESIRGLAFSCTDLKYVTGSDDSTLKVLAAMKPLNVYGVQASLAAQL